MFKIKRNPTRLSFPSHKFVLEEGDSEHAAIPAPVLERLRNMAAAKQIDLEEPQATPTAPIVETPKDDALAKSLARVAELEKQLSDAQEEKTQLASAKDIAVKAHEAAEERANEAEQAAAQARQQLADTLAAAGAAPKDAGAAAATPAATPAAPTSTGSEAHEAAASASAGDGKGGKSSKASKG